MSSGYSENINNKANFVLGDISNSNDLDKILLEGAKKADKISSEKVKKTHELVGF